MLRSVLPDVLLAAVVVAHVLLAPYNKVEESFATQATHDIIYNGLDIESYDHLEFPGVVPRSFLGPLFLCAFTSPIVHLFGVSKFVAGLLVRITLGLLFVFAMALYRRTLAPTASVMLVIITALQFHIPFYASRLLPNSFALVSVVLSLAAANTGRWPLFVTLATGTFVVFRSDAAIFYAPYVLHMWISRKMPVYMSVVAALIATFFWLALSVSFDSFFWNHLLWPEGEVLYFNAYLNRSHEWGTAPWHWYFTSALPRALGPALPLALISPFVARTRPVLIAPLAFVALYSFLPHKEVRFIFMAIPLFNTAAANVAARAWSSGKAMRAVLLAAAVAAAAMTAVGTIRAHYNYPGGDALMQLHSAHASQNGIRVHIDVASAMTGVSRFGQARDGDWIYNKTENLSVQDRVDMFDVLLEADATPFADTHTIEYTTSGRAQAISQWGQWADPGASEISVLWKKQKSM